MPKISPLSLFASEVWCCGRGRSPSHELASIGSSLPMPSDCSLSCTDLASTPRNKTVFAFYTTV
ncbi:MAG: hypothetical protein KAF91_29845 [Nostoc sp. TH1S01]|nr:hypothetical protein [Nostoc sp. TH1S01]